jgi:hypothetical protein
MDYDLNIITRDMIPSDIFLCERSNKKDWEMIHFYEFENGLKYVIGSNFPIRSAEELIENIECDMRIILDCCNNPAELQEYYKDEFDMFYKYKDCEKIWNYYNKNKTLLKELIDSYKTESEVDSESELESVSDSESDFFDELEIDN